MCKFFSLVSDGKGKAYYFDWELRKQCLAEKMDYEPDSHTSIAEYYDYRGEKEDTLNKYEYNPLTKEFTIDQLNTTNDSKQIEQFCKDLNFKTIVPHLVIKPIMHPFEVAAPNKITRKHIQLLKKWDSVRDSVGDSVRDSVGDSVGDSVWDSVGASVGDSVGDSVRDSVWASVRDSVGASVRDSVGASVGDSVWAYTSQYFDIQEWKYIEHKKGKNPYQPLIDLYNAGLVPSFTGKKWRLHGGKNGKVLWEGELK